ncbi:MAG: hypothetical protein OHK0029_12610 [Armatimonadaceae bacterium]
MNRYNSAAGIKSIVITLAFVFLFVVAVLLDLQYLYLMAVTLAVLPLTSYLMAYFFAARFSASRSHPDTVAEGRQFPVTLHVTAKGGLPQAAVRIADHTPPFMAATELSDEVGGERPLDTELAQPLDLWDGNLGERTYVLNPSKRGVYKLGPARLETTDPLGLFTFSATLPVDSEVVVHPEPLVARDLTMGGEGTFGIRERDGKTRRGDGMDFHGVREYRHGDALRRVHWRTTARTGELVVVEFERAYQQDIVIGLDLLAGSDHGSGRETTLEYAVKVAATLVVRTLSAGGGVTLITQNHRAVVKPREGDPDAARFHLFDILARATADASHSLGDALYAARLEDGTHYTVLTSGGDARLTAFLDQRIHRGDSVQIYFFEPTSFGGPTVSSPAVAGAALTVVEKEHSPWDNGGRRLEYLLREVK